MRDRLEHEAQRQDVLAFCKDGDWLLLNDLGFEAKEFKAHGENAEVDDGSWLNLGSSCRFQLHPKSFSKPQTTYVALDPCINI